MTHPIRTIALGLAVALIAACARTTTTAVWKNPDYAGGKVRSVLVMGVAEDQLARRKYEDALAAAMRQRGVQASPSYQVLPASKKLSKAEIDAAIHARGFDGVLVTHVIGIDEETVYYPGYYRYYQRPYYGHYYGYYANTYDLVYREGYYDTFKTVSLETSLYEAPAGTLAWSMRSKSIDPENLELIVGSVVEQTVSNMAASGLL